MVETGHVRRPHRPADRPRPAQPDRARRSPRWRRPDGFEFTIRSDIPLSGGLGTSAAAIVAGSGGRGLDLRARRRPAGRGDAARGPPGQRGGRAARRLRAVRGRPRRALRPAATASSACWWCPDAAVRTAKAREALPSRIPVADAVFNIAHASLLVLGLARGRPRAGRPRPARPHPPAPPRAPLPALVGARRSRRRSSARSARRSPAPARPCSCGATSSQAARSPQRLRERADGWAEVLRVPFTPVGAATRF